MTMFIIVAVMVVPLVALGSVIYMSYLECKDED